MSQKRLLLLLFCTPLMLLTILTAALLHAKTFTVNSDTDAADNNPGDGICATAGGNCTLRAAIQEANLDVSFSTIKFASMFQDTHAISGCDLPALTNSISIDASDQWDYSQNLPGVEITGGGALCTHLTIASSGSNILGLSFKGSAETGVLISQGGGNTIGGYGAGERNLFGTARYGVWVSTSGTNNYIINNYFGTMDGETSPGGYWGERGIFVQAGLTSSTIISDNLIVGQSEAGIYLWAGGNTVSDNIIGLNGSRTTALPNKIGIFVYGDQNTINNNTIAGNTGHGVYLYHGDNNVLLKNYIGGYFHGNKGNGGDGVHNHVSDNTQIGQTNAQRIENAITGNSGNGIFVNLSAGVEILRNVISESGADGIHVVDSSGDIGGTAASEGNLISFNQGDGIHLKSSENVSVFGNFIGIYQDTGSLDGGNQGNGILLDSGSNNNAIGEENTSRGNWIGWNDGDGVRISGSNTHGNFVTGNVIGASPNWSFQAPNGNHGISIYDGAYNNHIGGLSGGNTVLSSGWSGVVIVNSSTNTVIANRIGTNLAHKKWGNTYYGVHVVGSGSGNSISFNEIAYNGTHNGSDNAEAGIKIDGSLTNIISQNSIHDNDGLGIELVNNGNADTAAPLITQASCSGPVNGTAGGSGWIIEIFSDRGDEGRIYQGTTTANSGGNWSWGGKLKGPNITATARTPSNNSSPFSSEFTIGSCTPWSMFLPAIIGRSDK